MHASVRASDVAIVLSSVLASVLVFDLFPGPAVLLALMVGAAGLVETRRGRLVGRRILDVFAGMLLAAAVVAVLALTAH